jgi:lysophospholipase L1-like esterase
MTRRALTGEAINRGRQTAQQILRHRARVASSDGPIGRAGVLIAEGDSWFDYPFDDVLEVLEDRYGYDVRSVARHGDRLEEMAYGSGQLEELARLLEKLQHSGNVPKAVLLSGGGNDIAGSEFGFLLNHALSANAGLNDHIVAGVIDERIRLAYLTIITTVTEICAATFARDVPIIVHGYDYPVPDGRGFAGGWWLLPGPWLEPGFRAKGYEDIRRRISIARELIDRFNDMLQEIAASGPWTHVRYVDLRKSLSAGIDDQAWWQEQRYKESWANELHPTRTGFALITRRLLEVVPR